MPKASSCTPLLVVASFLLATPVFSDGLAIDHQPVGCIASGKFPQLFARFDPADAVSRARLHFRPPGFAHWYSVPMKPEGYNFIGVLPRPDKGLARFEYYISATDKSFNESRTPEYAPDVVSGPAACQQNKLMASALSKARSVLVNPPEGIANAAKVPTGFSGDEVVAGSSGSAGGQQSAGTSGASGSAGPAAGATAVAGVAPAAAAGGAAATGGGFGTAAWIASGIVVAGGATAGVVVATRKDPASKDDDHDGVSELQGDCNDSDPAIKPNAPPVFTGHFDLTGSLNCASPPGSTGGPSIKNNSCQPLTIQSYTVAATLSCSDGFSDSASLDNTSKLATHTIPPATELEVLAETDPGGPLDCCGDVACSTFPELAGDVCTYTFVDTIVTSGGTIGGQRSYSYNLIECPACPAAASLQKHGACKALSRQRLAAQLL